MNATHDETPALSPYMIEAGQGEARWWMDSLAVIKTTAAHTGGQMSIIEITEPAGAQAPLHVHYREDEGFWILEGEATFEVGGQVFQARAGDYLFGPRGIPHRYTVGAAGCRMLFIFTPGGFEELIRLTSEPAQAHVVPPASDTPPDMEQFMAAVHAYGCEMLE